MRSGTRRPASSAEKSAGVAASLPTPRTVLHIDDDPNDTELLKAAAREAKALFQIHNVEDGETAMAYLNGAGEYAERARYPLPHLVLLDLKMPRASGFELLKWIRAQPHLCRLPVVILSGSELHEDIRLAFHQGANSYLIKPLGFEALVTMIKDVGDFWVTRQQPTASVPGYIPAE